MTATWPDPVPVLWTSRLRLRPLHPTDASAVQRIFSDDEVTRYHGLETMADLAPAQAAVQRVLDAQARQEAVRWAITLPPADEAVGTVGFLNVSLPHRRAELGYDLARPLWGQGIAPEAAATIVAFGFEVMALHRIEADVLPENLASARVLAKLGFRPEARLEDYLVIKGSPRTVLRHRLLATERS